MSQYSLIAAHIEVMKVFATQYRCACPPNDPLDSENGVLQVVRCAQDGYCAKAADDEHSPIAIEAVIKNLPQPVRDHLQHVFRNDLQAIAGSLEIGTKEESQAAIARMVVDLQRMGI